MVDSASLPISKWLVERIFNVSNKVMKYIDCHYTIHTCIEMSHYTKNFQLLCANLNLKYFRKYCIP